MILRKLHIHIQKNSIEPLSSPKIKSNSKWINDLNIRPESIKLLKIGGKFCNTSLNKNILHMTPKA